jgi:hypothetical protein
MSVDSYKYLPRSFRQGFENMPYAFEQPAWTLLTKPIEQATVALLSSAGLYLKDTQEPFDMEREKREPQWGDPSFRIIPRDTAQEHIGATHLHLNTRDHHEDYNVALPLRAFARLQAEGKIGRLADDNYAVMGYQGTDNTAWQRETGPEIARHLQQAEVDALILAPA